MCQLEISAQHFLMKCVPRSLEGTLVVNSPTFFHQFWHCQHWVILILEVDRSPSGHMDCLNPPIAPKVTAETYVPVFAVQFKGHRLGLQCASISHSQKNPGNYCYYWHIYTVSQKWGTHISQMWTNFNNFFTVVYVDELQKKVVFDLPPHLKSVAALPCKNWMFSCAALQHVIIYSIQ